MAAHTPWGPKPGESHRDYLDRLNAERLGRLARERGDPTPEPSPSETATPTGHEPSSPSGDTSLAAMSAAATTRGVEIDARAAADLGTGGAAWYKVGKSIGDIANRVAEKAGWQRGRVYNPKILQVDVKIPKRPVKPPAHWARDAIAAFSRARVVGRDVSAPYFMAVAGVVEKIASDNHGFVQRSYKSIGRLAGLGRTGVEGNWGRETVRKVMDWLRENGCFGPLNALYRDPETRELRRDFNVYLLFTQDDAAEISAIEDPSARALKRESLTLSRGALLWGLAVRPWGLNATPAPSNRHQTRARAAPG